MQHLGRDPAAPAVKLPFDPRSAVRDLGAEHAELGPRESWEDFSAAEAEAEIGSYTVITDYKP